MYLACLAADEQLWGSHLKPAQMEFIDLCRAIHPEPLQVLVRDHQAEEDARRHLADLNAHFYQVPYGDIWLRDTGPIFSRDTSGSIQAQVFRFNGWGGKYDLPHDKDVSRNICALAKASFVERNWVLEGGSIEWSNEGTCLTTEECLLNSNRNPHLSKSQIEAKLAEDFGFKKILWLKRGLINDHTDGHIDTLARFISDRAVVCMRTNKADPNFEVLEEIYETLCHSKNASDQTLQVYVIPSPVRF